MFEIWKLNRKIDKIHKLYSTEIEGAKGKGRSQNELNKIIHEFATEKFRIEEEIRSLVTRHLIRKASQLFLPVPEMDDPKMWVQGETGHWLLTENGIVKLRNRIREETSARRRAVLEWVSPLIGIIGAITGLLAVVFTVA